MWLVLPFQNSLEGIETYSPRNKKNVFLAHLPFQNSLEGIETQLQIFSRTALSFLPFQNSLEGIETFYFLFGKWAKGNPLPFQNSLEGIETNAFIIFDKIVISSYHFRIPWKGLKLCNPVNLFGTCFFLPFQNSLEGIETYYSPCKLTAYRYTYHFRIPWKGLKQSTTKTFIFIFSFLTILEFPGRD